MPTRMEMMPKMIFTQIFDVSYGDAWKWEAFQNHSLFRLPRRHWQASSSCFAAALAAARRRRRRRRWPWPLHVSVWRVDRAWHVLSRWSSKKSMVALHHAISSAVYAAAPKDGNRRRLMASKACWKCDWKPAWRTRLTWWKMCSISSDRKRRISAAWYELRVVMPSSEKFRSRGEWKAYPGHSTL